MNVGQVYRPYQLFVGCIIPNWLLRRGEISHGAKLLFARLAQYKGESGQCFPSQETLANELGTTDRNIRNMLTELVDYRLVRKIQRGLNQSNMYEFIWHEWAEDAASDENPERKNPSVQDRQNPSVQGRQNPSDKENHTKENHLKENQEDGEKSVIYAETPSPLPPRNTGNASNGYIPTIEECNEYATHPTCAFPPALVQEWYDRQCDRGWGNDWRARMRSSAATYRQIAHERKTFKRKTNVDVAASPADPKKRPPKTPWQLEQEEREREKQHVRLRRKQLRAEGKVLPFDPNLDGFGDYEEA